MNLDPLGKKLIAAARKNSPADTVPYAFEKRIMARVTAARPVADEWAQWARSLWLGAFACMVITIGIYNWSAPFDDELELAMDFSESIEQTLLAEDDVDFE